jgi:predicted nucleotidyltransferase
MNLPKLKQILLEDITNELKQVNGVRALVLGGSFAVGMATESSDIDIGIYYSEDKPFDIEEIKLIAQKYASKIATPTVTGFYEWGPWVNGGAWIETENGKVDFIYKNIKQIVTTIESAKNGIWENHFEQQPPYGFSSITFLAETKYCISLYDPNLIIENLKKEVQEYPPHLRKAVIQQSLWSAEFTIWQAKSFALKSDLFNTVGCLTRAIKSIITTLFAINEIYPLGDKRALNILEQADKTPINLTNKINYILCCTISSLYNYVQSITELFKETASLAEDLYKPYYKLI